jgi:hypothetical protein
MPVTIQLPTPDNSTIPVPLHPFACAVAFGSPFASPKLGLAPTTLSKTFYVWQAVPLYTETSTMQVHERATEFADKFGFDVWKLSGQGCFPMSAERHKTRPVNLAKSTGWAQFAYARTPVSLSEVRVKVETTGEGTVDIHGIKHAVIAKQKVDGVEFDVASVPIEHYVYDIVFPAPARFMEQMRRNAWDNIYASAAVGEKFNYDSVLGVISKGKASTAAEAVEALKALGM